MSSVPKTEYFVLFKKKKKMLDPVIPTHDPESLGMQGNILRGFRKLVIIYFLVKNIPKLINQ